MNTDNTYLNSLTEKVLGAVYEVSNTLGAGLLEKVYQRALLRELSLRGVRAAPEASFAVKYKGASTLLIPRRRGAAGGVEMRRTPGPMKRLPNALTICAPPASPCVFS